MRRSDVLVFSGAALAASALPGRAQALETVRIGNVGVEEGALPFYAQEKGFFKAAGLNIEVSTFANGGSVTQGVLGGAIDVGVTNSGSISSAHVRGLPLYVLACGALYSPASPIAHLVVNKTAGVKTAKELSGRTLGVSTLRDMIQATAMQWIDRNGGDSKTVNFVEVPMVQHEAAINAKRIDGSVMVEPIFTQAKAEVQELGLTYEAVNDRKPFQTLGIVGNKDWVDKNPATARKVASAIHEAGKWANNSRNYAEAATLLTRLTKIDLAVIQGYPRLSFAESNNPAYIQPVIDLMVRYGILPARYQASELFAPGIG